MIVLAQVIGVLEPENQKIGRDVLTLFYIPSCTIVHDNVAVAVIVSETLRFENLPLNVCHCHKR